MLSKKYIVSIMLLGFIVNQSNAQILEVYEEAKEAANTAIIIGINATEKEMAIEKKKNNAEEISKLETIKDYAEKQLDLTEKIYKHYLNVLETVETVSTTIQTYKKVETFYENIAEIMNLYADYGASFTFYSLYDLDKYINPESHTAYMNAMLGVFKEAETLSRRMKMILFNKKEGIEATDYERYQTIKILNKNSRELVYKAQNLVNMMLYLVPANTNTTKSNIEIKKSFYSYETYAK